MSANALYDNIRSYLRLSTRVVSKHGDYINVDEKFTIRFTGSNTAYSPYPVGKPSIIFLKASVYIEGTQYASPKGGNAWHALPDSTLWPGESSYVDVEFTAKENIGGFIDLFVSEHVAKAWIKADLDQNRFFQVWNYKDVYEEIEPT